MQKNKAFTLIELLVVISVIGLLSSVVQASLNTARIKTRETTIRANLANMIPQAELTYLNNTPNSYTGVCTGVANMVTAINSAGGIASCSTVDGTRWGASAKLNSTTPKSWAVGSSGNNVVTWDAADTGGTSVNWTTSTTNCAAAGGRLPTIEELQGLYTAYGGTPPAFAGDSYWSNTPHPSIANNVYLFHMGFGAVVWAASTNGEKARCVR